MENYIVPTLVILLFMGILGLIGGITIIFSKAEPVNKEFRRKIGIIRFFHSLSTILICSSLLILYRIDVIETYTALYIFCGLISPLFFLAIIMENRHKQNYSVILEKKEESEKINSPEL